MMSTQSPAPELDFQIPAGFRWAGVAAAIKKPGKRDIGLMVADQPCPVAGVFTRNAFAAAPVLLCRRMLAESGGLSRGVVVNSGCANAATGPQGEANARAMAVEAAESSNHPLLVCSTGTIGVQLPMDRIRKGLAEARAGLSPSREGFLDFAHAILTTDTREKIAWQTVNAEGRSARILGCAKGSGMMFPRMATMLSFVATDVEIDPASLDAVFRRAIDRSLNCLTVDGDTSTNDTALIFASGASRLRVEPGTAVFDAFEQALLRVLQSLARQLARDGEGATKLIEIEVAGAADFETARAIALQIANSNLVKTAIYGRDANWGRICSAAGNAPVPVDPAQVVVRLGNLTLFRLGAPLDLDEQAALAVLSQEVVRIEVEVGSGAGRATVWTCDLTEKYIEINGAYRT
ncbi:MAG: bifunctional glutamate N-acetyltransferase/amino-acid acetyltransferase ArgJ [Candidatus Sumerlaeaceae bacterium]|nr:bifunctional glutamate N-acetyltransferase/amino-acid acetyltransferase ArgJ [Candidatus Sumerlaeaceae bacterium]